MVFVTRKQAQQAEPGTEQTLGSNAHIPLFCLYINGFISKDRPRAHFLKLLTDAKVPANALSVIGCAMIAYAIVAYDDGTPFPGKYALLPVIGTALVLLFVQKSDEHVNLFYSVLSFKPLVGIGLISYSLYLWHQPLFAMARLYFDVVSAEKYIALITASIVISYFSYVFIEKKYIDRYIIRTKYIFYGFIASSLLLMGLGYAGVATSGYINRFSEYKLDLLISIEE